MNLHESIVKIKVLKLLGIPKSERSFTIMSVKSKYFYSKHFLYGTEWTCCIFINFWDFFLPASSYLVPTCLLIFMKISVCTNYVLVKMEIFGDSDWNSKWRGSEKVHRVSPYSKSSWFYNVYWFFENLPPTYFFGLHVYSVAQSINLKLFRRTNMSLLIHKVLERTDSAELIFRHASNYTSKIKCNYYGFSKFETLWGKVSKVSQNNISNIFIDYFQNSCLLWIMRVVLRRFIGSQEENKRKVRLL